MACCDQLLGANAQREPPAFPGSLHALWIQSKGHRHQLCDGGEHLCSDPGWDRLPRHHDPVDRDSLQIDRIARPAIPGKPSIIMVSAGKPIPNTQVRIVDPKGNALPDRHIGEIACIPTVC